MEGANCNIGMDGDSETWSRYLRNSQGTYTKNTKSGTKVVIKQGRRKLQNREMEEIGEIGG